MTRSAVFTCTAVCIGLSAADLTQTIWGGDKPDPVHHRSVKREVRKQQREQAKRMARARKGV
jgi:hypothetical protein